jgi:hypothetical protein
VLRVFERLVAHGAEGLRRPFSYTRPETQEGWSRLGPGLSLFRRDLAIRGDDAARLGGLGCRDICAGRRPAAFAVNELPHPRVRKDSELDSGGLVIRTWRRNATPESPIARHHAPSRRDHPSPRTLAGFVLQENQKDRRSLSLLAGHGNFFLDIRSGSCKYQSEYDPPMRLLLAQILDDFLGRRSGAQPCARVTMEDPPSTGSSSSRILQLNNFARPTESDAERLSRLSPPTTASQMLWQSARHQSLLVLSRIDAQIVSDSAYALRIFRYGYKTGCHGRILNLATQRHDAGRGFDMDIVGVDALASGKGCLHLCCDFRIS